MTPKVRLPLDRLRTICNHDLLALDLALRDRTAGVNDEGEAMFEDIQKGFVETLATFRGIVQECLPGAAVPTATTSSS